jgi:hypothetical protein
MDENVKNFKDTVLINFKNRKNRSIVNDVYNEFFKHADDVYSYMDDGHFVKFTYAPKYAYVFEHRSFMDSFVPKMKDAGISIIHFNHNLHLKCWEFQFEFI